MSKSRFCATCSFLDVGQGTSQILYMGGGKGIVIDGGPNADIPLRFLDSYVDFLVALIVSHNDADHHRGAFQILERYRGEVESVYFLEDRPFDRIGLYELAERRLREGSIRRVIRLERSDRCHILYENHEIGLTLDLLYPEFLDNLNARRRGDPNITSAVLALECGKGRIVFPGDSTIEAWKRIHQRLGGPVICDVLAVPHHGGMITRGTKEKQSEMMGSAVENPETADSFYEQFVICKHAIISAGTHNTYGHPRASVIRALRTAGGLKRNILCTQMTAQCCDAAHLRRIFPGLMEMSNRSGSHKDLTPETSPTRGVSCAGTVLVKMGRDRLEIERISDHQGRLDELSINPWWHPLCRP